MSKFSFGDTVRVIEQAAGKPVLGKIINVLEDGLVDIIKWSGGAWQQVDGIKTAASLADAQAEDAGGHAVHVVAPLVDPEPEPEPAPVDDSQLVQVSG